jgi:predicted aspartyl protease
MATTIGSTGSSGSPCIRIKISGAFTANTQEFEVTVDTGFTGFISMPIMTALPLGLPLYGTTSVQFGDGKTSTRFTALGAAQLGDESEAGVVILEPSTSTILVGMEFLNAFKKTVFLHRGVLVLLDQNEMDKTLPPEVIEVIKKMIAPVDPPTTPKEETTPPAPEP